MPIEIFQTGTHTSEDGTKWEFPNSVVQQFVDNYDPAIFSAPLVVGHPTLEAPAYGWAEKLQLVNGKVEMSTQDVEPAFAALVNNKRFPKVSASFFPPEHPANPKPGEWYLRHVGFLGAAAPAIPGLKPASFSAVSDGLVTINFAATKQAPPTPNPTTQQKVATMTEEELKAQAEKLKQQTADFAAQQSDFEKKAAELAAREQGLADKEAAAKKSEVANFAAELAESGKILPREQAGIEALLAGLPETQAVSFAAADGTKTEQSAPKFLREFLNGLPKRVDYQEHAAQPDQQQQQTASFSAPNGYEVDASRMAMHNKILAYQQQHKVDYATAASAVGA